MSRTPWASVLPPAPWVGVAGIVAVVAIFVPSLRAQVLTVACIALSFYRLDLAVLLWLATSGLAPQPLVQVRNSVVLLTLAVLSVLLVQEGVQRLRRGRLDLPRSRLTVPLIAIAATAIASGLVGAVFYDPAVPGVHRYVLAQAYATALVVLSVATPLLINEEIRTRRALFAAVSILVGVGLFLTVIALVGSHWFAYPRWYPIIITYAFTFIYAALLQRTPTSKWQCVAALVGVAVILEGPASNFFFDRSQWVSGWLMIGVPMLLLPVLSYPRTALVAIVVGSLISLPWMWPLFVNAYDLAQHEGDFGRLRIWQDALLMGGLRPFLGVGLGNYIDYAERYAQVDIALGSAHGNYQQIIAEMGLTGLGFVLWMLVRASGIAWRLFRTAADPLHRVIGFAVLGGLSGQATAAVVGDYLLPAYHNGGHSNVATTIYTWMAIGVLMVAERMAAEERGHPERSGV